MGGGGVVVVVIVVVVVVVVVVVFCLFVFFVLFFVGLSLLTMTNPNEMREACMEVSKSFGMPLVNCPSFA